MRVVCIVFFLVVYPQFSVASKIVNLKKLKVLKVKYTEGKEPAFPNKNIGSYKANQSGVSRARANSKGSNLLLKNSFTQQLDSTVHSRNLREHYQGNILPFRK